MIPPKRYQPNTTAFDDYWTFEDGRQMLDKLKSVPDISKADHYVPLLFQKDDLADDVVNDIFLTRNFGEALQLVSKFITGENPIAEAPKSLQLMLAQMTDVPAWVDWNLINLGSAFCNRSGKSGLIVLRNYSLMLGYQSAAINKPLIATGALHSGAVKRIADTTNFWYAVTGKNALQKPNDGFMYCLRTRLVHAYSRIMIKKNVPWKLSDQAEPLNYWDMQATYIGFSLIYMQGLEKLGVAISDEEKDAVYHLWKYIGYLIGIPTNILPANEQQAIEQLYLWSKTQPITDDDSIALASALHLEPLGAPWPPKKFQKRFIQQVNLAFNQYLIGERSCKVLELPKAEHPIIADVVVFFNKIDAALSFFSWYKKFQENNGRREQLIIRNRVNLK